MATVRLSAVAVSISIVAGLSAGARAVSAQTASGPAGSPAADPRAIFTRYCVSCHNERLKTGGLMLDQLDVRDVGAEPATWEKVVRKLRARSMPPAGRPRPDDATYERSAAWLMAELDKAAAAHPNPGRTPVHRLNRTEYQNVVRDLLALDVNMSAWLPGDDEAFGFDNIADLLKVSPDLLDGYLAAANKISRLAVGDKALGLGSANYVVSKLYLQNDQMSEELPFGSRGGTAVRHYFPYDGEYIVKIGVGGTARPPAAVEVRVDGALVASLLTAGRGDVDPPEVGAVQTRVGVKAGPRVVGISLPQPLLQAESRYPQFYPWGNSATFGTNVGAVGYLKIETVDVAGPFNSVGAGDTPSRRRIFVCQPTTLAEEEPCAKKILTTLARRAFRRPVTPRDEQPLLDAYRAARDGESFDTGIQAALELLLVDPRFLFRIEGDPSAKPGTPYRISDVQLASRLSFFLWSSMPDDELLEQAERGKLRDPAVFERQVRRMLADERASALATNFATQWLYLRNVKALVPDSYQFPDWDEDLRAAMSRETELFLTSQVREDRSVMELLTANYTFVNDRLARHYGIANVYGSRFRRVTLPADGRRSGLLGHASILAVTSQPNRTSPVQRGKWVLENLLGTPPPPPPPDVPDLPVNQKEQPKTIRARMEQHRQNPVCAGCHATMDPLGFALENFDAIGVWRTRADGQPIDNTASLPDGTKLDGPDGLRRLIQSRRTLFLDTLTEKLLTYALGRGIEHYDMPAVRKITREAAAKDFRWSSIILGITTSTPFQMSVRRAE